MLVCWPSCLCILIQGSKAADHTLQICRLHACWTHWMQDCTVFCITGSVIARPSQYHCITNASGAIMARMLKPAFETSRLMTLAVVHTAAGPTVEDMLNRWIMARNAAGMQAAMAARAAQQGPFQQSHSLPPPPRSQNQLDVLADVASEAVTKQLEVGMPQSNVLAMHSGMPWPMQTAHWPAAFSHARG